MRDGSEMNELMKPSNYPTPFELQKTMEKMSRVEYEQHCEAYQKLIAKVSLYYRDELNKVQIEMYASELGQIPYACVHKAFREIAKDPEVRRFPLPGKVAKAAWRIYLKEREQVHGKLQAPKTDKETAKKYMNEIWRALDAQNEETEGQ